MAVKNSLVEQNNKPTFSTFITQDAVKNKINQIVGGKDGNRFITAILSAVSTNQALAECDHGSILSAAMLGESLKLSPSPQLGQYYMVPYKKKDRNGNIESTTAQFQLGYKGYIQLAIRSGYYKKINVLSIKEGELIKYDPLNEEIEVKLIENDIEREEAETTGYYAMFEYLNGFRKTMYWGIGKMEAHANQYSQAFNLISYNKIKAGEIKQADMWKYSSYWYKDFDGMAYKTMLRQLISKWGIMSIELQSAMEKDMGVIDESGNVEYVENSPYENVVEVEEPPKEKKKGKDVQEDFFNDTQA